MRVAMRGIAEFHRLDRTASATGKQSSKVSTRKPSDKDGVFTPEG